MKFSPLFKHYTSAVSETVWLKTSPESQTEPNTEQGKYDMREGETETQSGRETVSQRVTVQLQVPVSVNAMFAYV